MTNPRRLLEQKATNWLAAVYFSELGFLGLAYFLVSVPTKLELPKLKFTGWVARFIAKIRNEAPPSGYSDADIQSNHFWVFSIVFLIRGILNITALSLILKDTIHISAEKRDAINEIRTYADSTVESAANISGWWILLASFILNWCTYVFHKHLLENSNPMIQERIYTVSHLSFVNFIIDFPGFYSDATQASRWLCTILNCTAGLILAFVLLVEEPFLNAWSCYPTSDNILDFKYGLCPSYFSTTEASYQPICDRPGTRCGEGVILTKQYFHRAYNISHALVSLSVGIYLLTIPQKVSFFQLCAKQAEALTPEKIKQL